MLIEYSEIREVECDKNSVFLTTQSKRPLKMDFSSHEEAEEWVDVIFSMLDGRPQALDLIVGYIADLKYFSFLEGKVQNTARWIGELPETISVKSISKTPSVERITKTLAVTSPTKQPVKNAKVLERLAQNDMELLIAGNIKNKKENVSSKKLEKAMRSKDKKREDKKERPLSIKSKIAKQATTTEYSAGAATRDLAKDIQQSKLATKLEKNRKSFEKKADKDRKSHIPKQPEKKQTLESWLQENEKSEIPVEAKSVGVPNQDKASKLKKWLEENGESNLE